MAGMSELRYTFYFILFFHWGKYLKSALCKRYTKQFQDNNARVTLISRKITARSVYVIDIDIGLGHRVNSSMRTWSTISVSLIRF